MITPSPSSSNQKDPLVSPEQTADLVYCCDSSGKIFPIPSDQLLFRPAVYGVLLENTQVLLQAHPQTNRWHLPGGFVEREQAPDQALRQHFRAATGMMPLIRSVVMVDDLFYYDGQHGYRLSVLYYLLDRPDSGLVNLIDFNNEARPGWIPLSSLDRADMQFGYDAIQNAQLIGR